MSARNCVSLCILSGPLSNGQTMECARPRAQQAKINTGAGGYSNLLSFRLLLRPRTGALRGFDGKVSSCGLLQSCPSMMRRRLGLPLRAFLGLLQAFLQDG